MRVLKLIILFSIMIFFENTYAVKLISNTYQNNSTYDNLNIIPSNYETKSKDKYNNILSDIKIAKNTTNNAKNVKLLCNTKLLSDSSEIQADNSKDSSYEYIIETVQELLDGLELDKLDEEFSTEEFFVGESSREKIIELISGNYNLEGEEFLKSLLNTFFSGLGNLSGYFAIIIAIAILNAVLNAIKPSFMDKSLSNLMHFVSLATVIGIIASLFSQVYKSTLNASLVLDGQAEVVFPILLTIITASGATATNAVLKPQMVFLLKTMSFVVQNILLPITVLLFVFNAVGSMSEKYKFEKVNKFLKSAFKWISGLTVVVFNFLITTQGIIASIYDGVSIKALKYALGNSIPIVGNIVNGGFDVVFASLVLIKNAIGSFALLAVLFQVVSPIIKIAALVLFLRFTTAIIEPVCDVRLNTFLSNVADIGGYLTAIVAVGSSSYFITLLFVINSLGGVV